MTLKDCLYRMVHKNKKPLKVIAEEIDMSENYLYRSVTPDSDESQNGTGCRFPLKKLIPITRSTGDFSALDFIEHSLGRVAIPLPSPMNNLPDIYRLTMCSVKEFGELMAEIEKAVAVDGIDESEKARIVEEGNEAVQAVMNLLSNLEKGK